jgi:hypothetical protein
MKEVKIEGFGLTGRCIKSSLFPEIPDLALCFHCFAPLKDAVLQVTS